MLFIKCIFLSILTLVLIVFMVFLLFRYTIIFAVIFVLLIASVFYDELKGVNKN